MLPGSHLEYIDTGTVYNGAASHACTLDVTRGMTYGLGGLVQLPQVPPMLPEYMKDHDTNKYSNFDGGQIMYNFLIGSKTLLWSGHLGCYEGILKGLETAPDVAILAIAGRANLNGRPYDGSAAEFACKQIKWLGEPERVLWCLHDRMPIRPLYVDTKAATDSVHRETKTKVVDLKPARVWKVW